VNVIDLQQRGHPHIRQMVSQRAGSSGRMGHRHLVDIWGDCLSTHSHLLTINEITILSVCQPADYNTLL
jgi:hypothetical protein